MTVGICVMLFTTGGFSVGKLPAESHFVVTGLKIKRGKAIADYEVRLAPLAGCGLSLLLIPLQCGLPSLSPPFPGALRDRPEWAFAAFRTFSVSI